MEKKVCAVCHKGDEFAVDFLKKIIVDKKKQDDYKILEMTEEQYFDNRMQMSSDQKIIFLGDVKKKNDIAPTMDSLYNSHKVVIGKSGKLMLITATSLPLFNKKRYQAFMEEFKSIADHLPEDMRREIPDLLTWRDIVLSCLPCGLGRLYGTYRGLRTGFDIKQCKDHMHKQQMIFAVAKFCELFLDDFMKA